MQLHLISRQGCISTTCSRVNAYKNATAIQAESMNLLKCYILQMAGGLSQVRWSPDQKQIISAGKVGPPVTQTHTICIRLLLPRLVSKIK